MAKKNVKKGATDVTVYVMAYDSTSLTGGRKTGLAYNTASLVAYYVRDLGSATVITLATQTVEGAHSDGGFVEVSSANMPGLYRLDLPDAVCASGASGAIVTLKGATGLVQIDLELELVNYDPADGARMGLTSLPTAAPAANGGLPTVNASNHVAGVASGVTLAATTHTGAVIPVVTDVTTKTGYSLSAAGIQAIWDALMSAFTTVGSIGKFLVDRIDATISSRMAAFVYTAPPTAEAIADQVWDEALSGHTTGGSAGAGLSAAGAAGDPWSTTLPGGYTGEQAGAILDRMDAQLATSAAAVAAAVANGENLTAYRGDSFSVNFSGLGNVAARTKVWFTVKGLATQADTEAMIQITEAAGLVVVMGAAAETAANGALTVTDAADGDMTITLNEVETARMPVERKLVYDIQMLTASGVTTLAAGTLRFSADVTRATS